MAKDQFTLWWSWPLLASYLITTEYIHTQWHDKCSQLVFCPWKSIFSFHKLHNITFMHAYIRNVNVSLFSSTHHCEFTKNLSTILTYVIIFMGWNVWIFMFHVHFIVSWTKIVIDLCTKILYFVCAMDGSKGQSVLYFL